MRPFCAVRRCRYYVKLCALLLAVFLTARYLTGHLSVDHFHGRPALLPADSPVTTNNVFAAHFQAGFSFQHDQKPLPAKLTQDKTPDKLRRPNKKLRVPNDWPEFFQPRQEEQFSMGYPYLHRASRACPPSVKMLVLTLSLPQNYGQRQAIRQTWGSVARTGRWPGSPPQTVPEGLGIVFLLGEERSPQPQVSEAVNNESSQYGDIVQWQGLQDTYFNLTMKVLMGLKWATLECPKASHVIKTDDDTFVHVPRLVQLLRTTAADNTIWGPYFSTSPCERVGKYTVSEQAYPFDKYTPHVKGNLYVLSADLASRLVGLAPYLPYNNMEDVHVTGTMARSLGSRYRPFSRKEFSVIPKTPSPCLFQDNAVALGSQMVSPDLHYRFWNILSGTLSCRDQKS